MAKIFNSNNIAQGSLNGNFEDVLNYLSYIINLDTRTGAIKLDAQKRGEEFFNAIKTLKENFGVEVSTEYLKNLVERKLVGVMISKEYLKNLKDIFGVEVTQEVTEYQQEFKFEEYDRNAHIRYLLRIGGFLDTTESPQMLMINPTNVSFRVRAINGQRQENEKTFDFLVMPNDWFFQKAQRENFLEESIKEWKDYALMIEQERKEAEKLKLFSGISETPMDLQELEDVSPHLIKKDRTLMPKYRNRQGSH